MTTLKVSPLILRSLYRSLWRATKPFTPPAPTAVAFHCLLDRTGMEDYHGWGPYQTQSAMEEDHDDNDDNDDSDGEEDFIPENLNATTPALLNKVFRRLLREVINASATSSGMLQMRFPFHMQPTTTATTTTTTTGDNHDNDTTSSKDTTDQNPESRKEENDDDDENVCGALRRILRREYRSGTDAVSMQLDAQGRQELAFLSLRKLNAKLAWMEELMQKAKDARQQGKTPPSWPRVKDVTLLPTQPPASYLQPGTFLLAHPNQTGYFRRSVVCIIDHSQRAHPGRSSGTYGLIINRPCIKDDHTITFSEALDELPDDICQAFGDNKVRDGGPVHAVLQMLHRPTESDRELSIGGDFLLLHPQAAPDSEREPIKYKGDMSTAAAAVMSGHALSADFSFLVGASCWGLGQLESEIERGFWLPCTAPVSLALNPSDGEFSLSIMDEIYVQMLAACGPQEAILADLIRYDDQEDHPFRSPSDNF